MRSSNSVIAVDVIYIAFCIAILLLWLATPLLGSPWWVPLNALLPAYFLGHAFAVLKWDLSDPRTRPRSGTKGAPWLTRH